MTIPRSQQIDIQSTPYYHVMTRCVRRSYICGVDKLTNKDYNHRKTWLVDRMKQLTDLFAINICSYAVMDNHYHLVLHVQEAAAQSWSNDEVKERWGRLFANEANKLGRLEKQPGTQKQVEDKIDSWRERLTSISWFMRCLNEPIARMSNAEDELTGRFWEGRFKSQSLLDEGALLSAMIYVDLNPVRAGIADTPETSEFTSIYERIQMVAKEQKRLIQASKPGTPATDIASICDSSQIAQPANLMRLERIDGNDLSELKAVIDLKLSDYLMLVDVTGRAIKEGKRGAIPDHLAPILDRLNLSCSGLLDMVNSLETGFSYAVGNEESLAKFNDSNRSHLLKGMTIVKNCYQRLTG